MSKTYNYNHDEPMIFLHCEVYVMLINESSCIIYRNNNDDNTLKVCVLYANYCYRIV